MKQTIFTKNPREASFLAHEFFFKNHILLEKSFASWVQNGEISQKDKQFAKEIAYGSMRKIFTLDYFSKQLLAPSKLNIKRKEKILLRQALYQHIYMDRVPLYAIVNETMKLAKRYCHQRSIAFLHAILRKIDTHSFSLPKKDMIEDLYVFYSYPEFFIKELLHDYGLQKTKEILDVQNRYFFPMVRKRNSKADNVDMLKEIYKGKSTVFQIKDLNLVKELSKNKNFYIQNVTPVYLIEKLASQSFNPEKILDLCSSPGGKLLQLHELFKNALLYANDLSQDKLVRLEENIQKYDLSVKVSCQDAKKYVSDEKYDLILLDVPCSNSGVLHKRPEARYRLSSENVNALLETQYAIIKNAKDLLSEKGQIWYVTCSILKKENEAMVDKVCRELNLKIVGDMHQVLPDIEGRDGGFCCSLVKK